MYDNLIRHLQYFQCVGYCHGTTEKCVTCQYKGNICGRAEYTRHEILGVAADALTALQSENAEKDQIIEALTIEVSDAEAILDAERKHNICVEAERDAAAKDMKLMADKAREEHGDDVPCFACRYDGDRSILPSGDFAEECPGFDREDCFEWRGAQGEGEKRRDAKSAPSATQDTTTL